MLVMGAYRADIATTQEVAAIWQRQYARPGVAA
jgi:hypothetical protein